jgi:hypothetical protein
MLVGRAAAARGLALSAGIVWKPNSSDHFVVLIDDARSEKFERILIGSAARAQRPCQLRKSQGMRLIGRCELKRNLNRHLKVKGAVRANGKAVETAHPVRVYAASDVSGKGRVAVAVRQHNETGFEGGDDDVLQADLQSPWRAKG